MNPVEPDPHDDRPGAAAGLPPEPAGAAPARGALGQRLARLGLQRDWDFALHLPLRYEDLRRVVPVAELAPGQEAQVEGEIVDSRVVLRGQRQLHATLRDDSGEVVLRWLHFYPSQREQVAVGRRVRAYGIVRGGLAGVEMLHPRLRRAGPGQAPAPAGLTPVYPSTEGLPQHWLRRRIARALLDVDLARADAVDVPQVEGWTLSRALRYLHAPADDADPQQLADRRHPAWTRVKLDELVAQQVALRIAREQRSRRRAPALAGGGGDPGLVERLLAALPFELTAAQRRVWDEVSADLACAEPMHRLVQGDVGSGKTVVAALAAARAIESGWQTALMAPTEILAEQHFGRIADLLRPLGVEVAWLAGRLKAAARRAALEATAGGAAGLVVGTHALVQEGVGFARLGLAIVDEQHRFGVMQRLALRSRPAAGAEGTVSGATTTPGAAEESPHLLMLSATPIPRTLAMSYLADLDVSVVDELPPGRHPVVTRLVAQRRRHVLVDAVRSQLDRGEQVYWVCPLVDATGDEPQPPAAPGGGPQAAGGPAAVRGEPRAAVPGAPAAPTAATEVVEALRAALPGAVVGLLHGQLPAAEKAGVMAEFAAGRIGLLVATTVVEVGVDVANATLMVIDHAQRFGLAQLHQLRGRVGRGTRRGWCVLLYDEPLSAAARERLRVIHATTDGFEIARRDLALRGPGEFLGARQSGQPLLRYAELDLDVALVEQARAIAADLLRRDPDGARTLARRWLAGREGLLAA